MLFFKKVELFKFIACFKRFLFFNSYLKKILHTKNLCKICVEFSKIKNICRITGTGIVITHPFDIVPVNRTTGETWGARVVKRIAVHAWNIPITCVARLVVSICATNAAFNANCNKKNNPKFTNYLKSEQVKLS